MSDAPEPDRLAGVPHPRDAPRVIGQDVAVGQIVEAGRVGRMPSGWLLTGPRGIGKATTAYAAAAWLLAGRPATFELGPDHPDRRLIAQDAHPRLHVLRRGHDEKTGKLRAQITADTVRGLRDFFHLSAADGGTRVVVADAVDEMNVTAANALLKELEEPPEGAVLFLVCHRPAAILPTIRSRCRILRLAGLGPDALGDVLAQTGVPSDAAASLAALTGGSAGDAIRLIQGGGMAMYEELVALAAPSFDRARALKLADGCAGATNAPRLAMFADLAGLLLARLSRAGILGVPDVQAAPGEARMLSRLSPHDGAARAWAALAPVLDAELRHGIAVNLDPGALVLDTLRRIEAQAARVA
ncbi:MAG: DNA polymerase III subunit delta' [Paracoccaceae bacterium]